MEMKDVCQEALDSLRAELSLRNGRPSAEQARQVGARRLMKICECTRPCKQARPQALLLFAPAGLVI